MERADDLKKFLPIVAIAVGVLIIVGVIAFALSNSNSNTEPASEKVEIEVWGLWEPESVMRPVIEKYEAENPNVTINYSQRTFTQYRENSLGRLDEVEGPGPDIVLIHNSWLPLFEDKLTPMPSEIISRDDYSKNFYPTALDDFTGTNGEIYAIPLMYDGLGMYYNKDLLSKAGISSPPDDWNKFQEVALKLTEKDSRGNIKTAGAAIGTSNNINHYFELLSVLMLQNNVQMMSSDQLTAAFASSENQNRGAATLDFYTSFAEPDSDNYVWSDALGNDMEAFANGQVAFMFAPSWRTFDVINYNPALDFDIAPLPQLPSSETTTSPTINWSSYWAYGVSAKADNSTEAWKFVTFLSEAENQKTFFNEASKIRAFGEIYSRPDLADDLRGQQYVDAYIVMAPTAKDWAMRDDEKAKELFGAAIDRKLGGETSKSALKETAVQLTNHLGGDPTLVE